MKIVPADYAESHRHPGRSAGSAAEAVHLDLLGSGLRAAYGAGAHAMPERLIALVRRLDGQGAGPAS